MKRTTILMAAFLCLFGLTESPAQKHSQKYGTVKSDTGMGQDVPEERQGEP